MPPSLALCVFFILLVALLAFDPAKDSRVSLALWVPWTWMVIVGSRLPSQWLGADTGAAAAQGLQDGDPLDRTVFLLLIVLAAAVLRSRSFRWGHFFAHNIALTALLSFCLLSVIWSDFPFVAFKRWFRDLGNYIVILVVLSDPHPLEALRTLLRRLCYLLIPLSIVLIKYFPQLGRSYDEFTGGVTYSGVQTSKYLLGTLCMISGIFFFWDTVTRWSKRGERRTRRIVAVNVAFFAMTLWLLYMANAATCRVCLLLGCMVVAAAHSKAVRRHPRPLMFLIPLSVCLCLFLVFGIDMKASIAGAVGRDPTFTDRTLLWSYLIKMKTNPVIGTGYESFWLGHRLQELWANFVFLPNQAHNGYLEVYLNLGVVGVLFVALFLIASYRTICKRFSSQPSQSSFFLALWAILPIYNITTSDFGKGELMWLTFLLGAIVVPRPAGRPRQARPQSQIQGRDASPGREIATSRSRTGIGIENTVNFSEEA